MARNKDPNKFFFGEESPVQPELEPGPRLDYKTIYSWAVQFAPLFKDRAEKKKFFEAFEAVAEARSNYHRCSLENQKAHNEVQDTSMFHNMMTERKEEVEKQIALWQEKEGMESVLKKKEMELETIKWQIKMNHKSCTALFPKAQTLARLKAQVSMHFVDMKMSLIKNHLPQMAALEKQFWKEQQDRATRKRMAQIKGSYCSHFLNRFYADHKQGAQPRELSTIEKQALMRYHQATHGEIVNRLTPSPQLARAIEQARMAVGQLSAGPPGSTS